MHQLTLSLQDIPRQIGLLPKAVLVISAHWEERDAFAVRASPRPPMLYDYGDFPAHLYQVISTPRPARRRWPPSSTA